MLLFFIVADFGLDELQNHVMQVQQYQVAVENGEVIASNSTTQTYFGKDIIDFLLQFSITSWIVGFF